jgi:hypothetical protein
MRMTASRPGRRPPFNLPLVAFGATVLGLITAGAAPRSAPDPLALMLADDWNEATRATLIDLIRGLGSAACGTLSAYSNAQDARAREHAVRALDLAGCDTVEDYRPYFADRAPWVVDAVIAAAGNHRIVAASSFVLEHVDDRRRLVSDDGTWTIEEAAHRVLRRLTGQPMPFAAGDPPAARDRAAAAWRAWMAAHRAEPLSVWLASGREAARRALQGGNAAARMAALETLALADTEGQAILRDALLRAPGEIEASLECLPEEPPRVTETVGCTLNLRNVTARRIAMALGGPVIALAVASPAPPPDESRDAGARHDPRGSGGSKGKGAGPPPEPAPPPSPPPPSVTAADLSGRFVDLAPGGSKTYALTAGPALSAGRFVVRATVRDLGATLAGTPKGLPDRLEATTGLRFEQ